MLSWGSAAQPRLRYRPVDLRSTAATSCAKEGDQPCEERCLYGNADIRFEDTPEPKITSHGCHHRLAATCVCDRTCGAIAVLASEPTRADGARVLRHRRGGRLRGQDCETRPVRHRLLLCFRQHLPSLQLWAISLLPAARIRRMSPGSAATCSSCGGHSRADSRSSCKGDDSEPSRDLRCSRDGLVAADAANVRPGMTVAVVGDGAVGLLAVLSGQQMGAERIIAMSRHEKTTEARSGVWRDRHRDGAR